ncbi:hypothetical protein J2127_001139 [Methanococcus voltae]|uniref:hypothetical protein n=1 Tax=Methanococcus voltae TaxID=2188 RepID=UPI001AE13234|nr:hypothetical protein [Methanococcus voltae]MBP2143970.1 hypothetical protein [Methanococcus voltae]
MKVKSKNNCKIGANEYTTHNEHTNYKNIKSSKGVIYQILINLTMISYAVYSKDFKSFLNFFIVNILVLNFIYADVIFNFIVIAGSKILNVYNIHANSSYKIFKGLNNFNKIEFPNSSKITGVKPIRPSNAVKKCTSDVESFQQG